MEDFYTHIDDYKNGLLEGEALRQFEEELGRNISLQKAVENYDVAVGISEGLLEVDMMETLRRLKNESDIKNDFESSKDDTSMINIGDGENRNDGKDKKWALRRWIAAASFIGVIFFAGWWVMDWNDEREFRQYVSENTRRPTNVEGEKSSISDTLNMTPFEKGKLMFELYRYEECSKILNNYLKENPEIKIKDEVHYWLGASYVNQWKIEEAKSEWEQSNHEDAKWNLNFLESAMKNR